MSITDDEQTMEEQILPKYDNIKSNSPVIRPVISTTTDPLSENESVKNDKEEDDEFLCLLYCGGYKNIDCYLLYFEVYRQVLGYKVLNVNE